MSILIGQSPQTVYSSFAVFGTSVYGYSCIAAVYKDTAATIDYVNIKAARLGSSGDVIVRIYDTPYTDLSEISGLNDGDSVTIGNLIGTKTEDSSGWSTSLVNRTFTFDSPINLPDHGIYIFTVHHPTGDSNNCIKWAFPTGSNYTQVKSTDGGSSFKKYTTITGIYQVYGTVGTAPGKPTNPSPSHEATDITLDETPLSWDASDPAADTYEIYFREQGDDWELVGIAQAGIEWAISFGTLSYNKTYEWRIDATNEYGTTTGDTWNFGSIAFAPPLPSGITLDGSGEGDGSPTGTPTGENNMFTIKRLIVAANNKIFYEDV